MKLAILLTQALCPFVVAAVEVHTNIAGLDVTLEAAHATFPTGAPIVVTVIMTNGTGKMLDWWGGVISSECMCEFGFTELRNPSTGSSVLPKPHGMTLTPSRTGDQRLPSDVLHLPCPLSHCYVLTNPGPYAVRYFVRVPKGMATPEALIGTPALCLSIRDRPPSADWNRETVIEQRGPIAEGWSLAVQMPRKEYALGEPIPVVVLLQNEAATNRPMREPTTVPIMCELALKKPDGGNVRLAGATQMRGREAARDIGARKKTDDERWAWFDVSIPPGGQRWYDYFLDQVFAIESPGDFTLEVRLNPPPPRYRRGGPTVSMPALSCSPISFKVVSPRGSDAQPK